MNILHRLENIQQQHQTLAAVRGKAARPINIIDWDPPNIVEDLIGLATKEQPGTAGRLVPRRGEQELLHLLRAFGLWTRVKIVGQAVERFEMVIEVEGDVFQTGQRQLDQLCEAELLLV